MARAGAKTPCVDASVQLLAEPDEGRAGMTGIHGCETDCGPMSGRLYRLHRRFAWRAFVAGSGCKSGLPAPGGRCLHAALVSKITG